MRSGIAQAGERQWHLPEGLRRRRVGRIWNFFNIFLKGNCLKLIALLGFAVLAMSIFMSMRSMLAGRFAAGCRQIDGSHLELRLTNLSTSTLWFDATTGKSPDLIVHTPVGGIHLSQSWPRSILGIIALPPFSGSNWTLSFSATQAVSKMEVSVRVPTSREVVKLRSMQLSGNRRVQDILGTIGKFKDCVIPFSTGDVFQTSIVGFTNDLKKIAERQNWKESCSTLF